MKRGTILKAVTYLIESKMPSDYKMDSSFVRKKHCQLNYDTSTVKYILIFKMLKCGWKISILELMKYSITYVTLPLPPCHREMGFYSQ